MNWWQFIFVEIKRNSTMAVGLNKLKKEINRGKTKAWRMNFIIIFMLLFFIPVSLSMFVYFHRNEFHLIHTEDRIWNNIRFWFAWKHGMKSIKMLKDLPRYKSWFILYETLLFFRVCAFTFITLSVVSRDTINETERQRKREREREIF